MSWVRKASKCNQGWPFREEPCHLGDDACPGSDVYVYEHVDGGIVCCMCDLASGPFDKFVTADDAGMRAHLRDHVAAGHHVAAMLLREETWAE